MAHELYPCGSSHPSAYLSRREFAGISGELVDIYKSCLLCKARIEPTTPPLGKCSKADCAMIQLEQKTIAKAKNLNLFDEATIHAKVLKVNSSDNTDTTRVGLWGIDMITKGGMQLLY